MNIVFIGAGNLATSLSLELQNAGHCITQVWSRTLTSAQTLADKLNNSRPADNITQLSQTADLYVFAVKDNALATMVEQVAANFIGKHKPLFVHTAGTQPLDVLSPLTTHGHIGVFYPFQTFSKEHIISLSQTRFFIEADTPETLNELHLLASQLTPYIHISDITQRLYLHLSGVIACNFSNCLYAIAGEILSAANLPLDILYPVIDETAAKIHSMSPRQAQSGPAARHDTLTINKHLRLLAQLYPHHNNEQDDSAKLPNISDIYRFFTDNIEQHS